MLVITKIFTKTLFPKMFTGWFVLRFNATLTAKVISWRSVTHVFPGFLTSVLTQISFQSHQLLFSHALAEVRGENMPERKFASNGSQTNNHQVMSPTRSQLSHTIEAKSRSQMDCMVKCQFKIIVSMLIRCRYQLL